MQLPFTTNEGSLHVDDSSQNLSETRAQQRVRFNKMLEFDY